MYDITLIDFWMSNQPCMAEIHPISLCSIILLYTAEFDLWIFFKDFASVFMEYIGP